MISVTNDVQTPKLVIVNYKTARHAPGQVRDSILQVLAHTNDSLSAKEIAKRVAALIGPTPESSVRSFLRLNTPELFVNERRSVYQLHRNQDNGHQLSADSLMTWEEPVVYRVAILVHGDCFDWLNKQDDNSIHAVVTDPPYGLHRRRSLGESGL